MTVGFALVDKPPGPTSHDVVDVIRRALGVRRVGHAGTLDPPASGLVVVAVGPATRLVRYVQQLPKVYEAEAVLGVRTSTLDADGEVLATEPVTASRGDVVAVAASFVGEIAQTPPVVSAVKVRGERAYKRAARGETIELEPRRVTIYDLQITGVDGDVFALRMRCSSGTYVRSLVADIGERLGCGAHVRSLRRTAIGSLTVDDAVAPDDVTADRVLPVRDALRDLPAVEVDEPTAARASNGVRIPADAVDGDVLVVGPAGAVGVFRSEAGILSPVTVLGRAS